MPQATVRQRMAATLAEQATAVRMNAAIPMTARARPGSHA